MADKEKLVEQFKQTTGETSERAQFILDASNWNLENAVDSYYGDIGEEETPEELQEQWRPAAPQSGRGVATLGDYHPPEQDPQDDEPQTFFAGGSEHSGQLISGPPREKKPNELAQAVFDAAKKQGATPVEEEQKQAQQVKKKKSLFGGAGYKLGQNEGPSEMVGKPRPPTTGDTPERRRVIKFWSNGFSVDDGPLRDGQASEDKLFLESVSKGEIPTELRHAVKGGEVHVEVEDHRREPFSLPKKTMAAFAGEGHKLGNMSPQVISSPKQSSSSSSSSSTAAGSGVGGGSEEPKPVELPLDPTQPTTQLQIRLGNGGRLVGKFNHGHTVGDIRSFINQSKPGGSHSYRLLTTFPNKELTDDSVTLSEAKLINAVVVQRMK